MKRLQLGLKNAKLEKKVEQVLNETVIHKKPFVFEQGRWPFVVFGAGSKNSSVIRTGYAQQTVIRKAPIYIATLAGNHIPDSEGMPIEELVGDDIPKEIAGLKVFHLNPMRPLTITAKKTGPAPKNARSEITDIYKDDNSTAIIETPDEAYWSLSLLKYLDEIDKFSMDPVMDNFYSRLGQHASTRKNSNFKN